MHNGNESNHLIARFTTYLKVVAENTRNDIIRQNKRYIKSNFGDFVYFGAAVSFEDQYESERPIADDFEFESETMQAAFDRLRVRSKDILRYTFIHGLTEKEIALLVGCDREYVKKIRYRALRRLRELIIRGEIEL